MCDENSIRRKNESNLFFATRSSTAQIQPSVRDIRMFKMTAVESTVSLERSSYDNKFNFGIQ